MTYLLINMIGFDKVSILRTISKGISMLEILPKICH